MLILFPTHYSLYSFPSSSSSSLLSVSVSVSVFHSLFNHIQQNSYSTRTRTPHNPNPTKQSVDFCFVLFCYSVSDQTVVKWSNQFWTTSSIGFWKSEVDQASRSNSPSPRSDNSVALPQRFSCNSLTCWTFKRLSRFVFQYPLFVFRFYFRNLAFFDFQLGNLMWVCFDWFVSGIFVWKFLTNPVVFVFLFLIFGSVFVLGVFHLILCVYCWTP